MTTTNSISKAIYTSFLVVIYVAFFSVHCFFKTYLGADNNLCAGTSIVHAADAKHKTTEFKKGNDNKNKPLRLNKRFHPGDGFIIADIVSVEQPCLFVTTPTNIVYDNPTVAQVCLSLSLRAPPASAVS